MILQAHLARARLCEHASSKLLQGDELGAFSVPGAAPLGLDIAVLRRKRSGRQGGTDLQLHVRLEQLRARR